MMTVLDEHNWEFNGLGILQCHDCGLKAPAENRPDWFPGYGKPPKYFRCYPMNKLKVIEFDEQGLAVSRS